MTLYEAGTAYGSGATGLGTATSDGSGDFTITYDTTIARRMTLCGCAGR